MECIKMLLSNEHWYLINILTISLISSPIHTLFNCLSHYYHHFKLILQAAVLEDAGQILMRFNNRWYLKQSTLKQSIKFTLPNIYHFRCFLHVYFQQQNHKKSSCLSHLLFKILRFWKISFNHEKIHFTKFQNVQTQYIASFHRFMIKFRHQELGWPN